MELLKQTNKQTSQILAADLHSIFFHLSIDFVPSLTLVSRKEGISSRPVCTGGTITATKNCITVRIVLRHI